MKQEYRDLSKRKRLILAYLEKHPLSTVREISDKYASKRGNYDGVKSAISELKEEGKIESLIHRAVYFLKPPKNQEKRMLISIMKSPKVFQPSFKNLPFDDDFRVSKSLFPQVVEQCIHLFHMQFKIFLLETRLLGSDNLTYRQQKRLRRYFVTDFVGLLESYSYKNVYAQGWFIREREKDDPATKNPDQETILVWLSNYILVKYEQDQLYFKMMNRFKQIPFNERVQLLEMSVDDSPKDVALARDTTLKNVHRLLGPLMYEGGTTRTDI
ncbi:MAG: hypothetical protein KGI25_05325, partial [Thaumarchaeota archaeon]|nr:hypothetical protein [Nitrososphaerota archaeon]